MNNLDKQYQALLQDILDNGTKKGDRTGTGTISLFGKQIRHKMSEGFPLLTTKKMYTKGIITELLWFLRGDTNLKYLIDNDCHIWDGDAYKAYLKGVMFSSNPYDRNIISSKPSDKMVGMSEFKIGDDFTKEQFIEKIKTDDRFANAWGNLGPIYGKQWRKWGEKGNQYSDHNDFTTGIDQIANLIKTLKTNPDDRRMMVSAWNVAEVDQMTLPCCHYGFQVWTRELSLDERNYYYMSRYKGLPETNEELDKLNTPKRAISLMWNQRSVDTLLGLPFNIASYGFLLTLLGKIVNMVPDELIGNLGDTHLYLNHIEQAKEQIGRKLSGKERMEIFLRKHPIAVSADLVDEETNWFNEKGLEVYENILREVSNTIPSNTREPFPLPSLRINTEFWCPDDTQDGCTGLAGHYTENIDALLNGLQIDDFQIENYQSHSTIKAPLSN